MASSTALVPLRSRARSSGIVLAAATDRAHAFRRARLHSVLVRALRLSLPVAALGLIGYYGVSLRLASGVAGLTMTSAPTITAEDLVMNTPRYEGFGKNGERFVVTARTAQQDLRDRSAPIRLNGIDGRLTQPDQTVTDLKATRGTFDNKQSELVLFDGVDVVSQNGMRARLSRATVLTKEQKIFSQEPVQVEMPTGSIRSRQLAIDQKTRQIAFTHGVAAQLTPEARKTAGGVPVAVTPRAFGTGDQPLDITAERLDVDDTAKTAVFQGSVRAVQGEAVLESARLDIAYEGQVATPSGGGAAASAAPDTNAQSRVKRITAPTAVVMTQGADKVTSDRAEFDGAGEAAYLIGNVVMTSGTERTARADRADLDQRSDTVLLTGNVIVTQARNELKGRRLAVDRKSGRAQLTSPATPGLAAGRIFTRLYQEGKEGAPAARKAPAKAQGGAATGAPGLAIKTDPSQPIDVEAASLDVNDTARTAIYRGDVRAHQGEFHMATAEMTAFYTGQMGLNVAPGQSREAPKGQPVQLTRIEARRNVTVTTPDGQAVSGDWADFDVKANTVTIGGNVKIARGAVGSQSFGSSGKLLIDLTTGEYRMLDSPSAALADQIKRATGVQPGQAASPGQPLAAPAERPRMVIHPDHMKGFGLRTKPEAAAQQPAEGGQPKRPAARQAAPAEPGSIFASPGTN